MKINEEDKNAFTISVMGDTEGGGGGSAVYVEFDTEHGSINATFNELVQYYNDGKLVFTSVSDENNGVLSYTWGLLTKLKRTPNGQSITYEATITAFAIFDGDPVMQPTHFISNDPDETMIID